MLIKKISNRVAFRLDKLKQKKFEKSFDEEKLNILQGAALPRKGLFNITNICTTKCVFCAYQYDRDEKRIMSNELFELACRQFTELQPESWVSLTPLVGEPFTDADIFKKIAIAKNLGAKKIETYSNGSLLSRYADQILESGLTELYISFPDFNEKEYELIFRVQGYKTSLNGLSSLLRKHQETSSKLVIKINLRGRRELGIVYKEKDYIEKIAPFMDNNVSISPTYSYDNWGGMIKQEDLPVGMNLHKDLKYETNLPCQRLYKVMFLQNGDVKLCGCRYKGTIYEDLIVGNIYKNSLEEIWLSERVKEIRKDFIVGKYQEICVNCSHYKPLTHEYYRKYVKK